MAANASRRVAATGIATALPARCTRRDFPTGSGRRGSGASRRSPSSRQRRRTRRNGADRPASASWAPPVRRAIDVRRPAARPQRPAEQRSVAAPTAAAAALPADRRDWRGKPAPRGGAMPPTSDRERVAGHELRAPDSAVARLLQRPSLALAATRAPGGSRPIGEGRSPSPAAQALQRWQHSRQAPLPARTRSGTSHLERHAPPRVHRRRLSRPIDHRSNGDPVAARLSADCVTAAARRCRSR